MRKNGKHGESWGDVVNWGEHGYIKKHMGKLEETCETLGIAGKRG